ncbi:MAG: hypothetical protein C0597_14100 [Marinilabiliales bacterium]|nr:MAG: hypothetical protein C0597_14100 [Marinilabiliales bacterium]
MFRKLVHILTSILLLTVTAGFTVSKHYCGPRLVTVAINHEAESCCDMEGTSSCCHNESKTFQLEEDFITTPILQNDIVKSIDLFVFAYILINTNPISEEFSEAFTPESPPPKDTQTILSNLQSYLC